MVRVGPTNPLTLKLVKKLRDAHFKTKTAIWGEVADMISSSTRKRAEVNLSSISRLANEGETLLVPGKVLAAGVLKKKVDVCAFSFSAEAKKKIESAKGSCVAIETLLEKNPKGTGVRIFR